MVNKKVEKDVEKTLKTLFKNMENFGKLQPKKLFTVYKISFHQLFPYFSTIFYTTPPSLFYTNIFHYSTSPTITTTKY